MNLFLICFISGACFLLSFILFFHPLRQNITANKWLSFFIAITGAGFICSYINLTGTHPESRFIYKWLNSLLFLMGPTLYISVLYFINPTKQLEKIDYLHFVPFLIYGFIENTVYFNERSISTLILYTINTDVSFLVRDMLPFLLFFYIVKCYRTLIKHKKNMKLIASSIDEVDLHWLVNFLFTLLFVVIIWINDALFEFALLTKITNWLYAMSIFYLAYFSIRQKNIFAYKEKDIQDISEILEKQEIKITQTEGFGNNRPELIFKNKKNTTPRISDEQMAELTERLSLLMSNNKLFLDNELSLPTIADQLGISIHDTSYLINRTTQDNFYNYVNRYRVEEAKKLLTSTQMEKLNILGIAFASGFNSKTAFNTAFKKYTGVSPSVYAKNNKK